MSSLGFFYVFMCEVFKRLNVLFKEYNSKYNMQQNITNKHSQQEQHDKGVHPQLGYISLSLLQWTRLSGISLSKVLLKDAAQLQWIY